MVWPTNTIVRTVAGTYVSAALIPHVGTVTFTPTSAVVVEASSIKVLDKTSMIITLDAGGSFSVDLPVTDNKFLMPDVWAYDVTVNIYGSKPIHTRMFLPFTDGSPVSLLTSLPDNSVSLPVQQLRITSAEVSSVSEAIYLRGAPGPEGFALRYGTVAPTTEGSDGDFYINIATDYLYGPKQQGIWPSGISLTGPQGIQGIQGVAGFTILHGAINPTSEGVEGDFYINTVTNFIYGPKASGTWPSGVSLVGPQGIQGIPGVQTYGYNGPIPA